jgi:hypothetical protein
MKRSQVKTKKTIAAKTARRGTEQPKIDPRLEHVFGAIDEAWAALNTAADHPNLRGYSDLVSELLTSTFGARPAGVKRALATLVEHQYDGADDKLAELGAMADAHHRAHCVCCQRGHNGKAAA